MTYAGRTSTILRATVGARAILGWWALAAALAAPLAQAGPLEITVMTRNLYFGADLTPIAAAPNIPALIGAVTATYGDVLASNPVARIARIADEITAAQPHIVGLQEAILWRTRTPSVLTGSPGPEVVAFDFIDMLLAELGPTYKLAVKTQGFDASAPGLLSGVLSDIRLTDREAILVRADLPPDQFKVLGTGTGTYSAFVAAPVAGGAGGTVNSFRTFAFVDIGVGDEKLRVVSTHLEPDIAPIRIAQGNELIGMLGAQSLPLIVMGDFNSRADGPVTESYARMLAAGYTDAWLEEGIGPGYTCCQAENLLNDPSTLDQRIDFVFHRGRFNTSSIDVIGEESPADRAASGHWPSDHAGVLATFEIPEPGTMMLIVIALAGLTMTRYPRGKRGGSPLSRFPCRSEGMRVKLRP